MAIDKNGSPRTVLDGVDDQSVPPLAPVRAGKPIHLPYIFTFAPKGEAGKAFIASGDNMLSYFGDITKMRSAHATFNTPFIELFNRLGNDMLIQRIVPDDAKLATLRVYAEVVKTLVGGVEKLSIVWRLGEINATTGPFKNGNTFAGTLPSTISDETSTIYPLFDLPAAYVGGIGVNYGIKLSCPNTKSKNPVNPDIIDAIGSRLMELQFVERLEEGQTPVIHRGLTGQTSVQFSFKPGAYYAPLRLDLDHTEVVMRAYRDMNPAPGLTPDTGLVSDFYVYQQNLETVLDLAKSVLVSNPVTDKYLVDIFTGLDVNGQPYNEIAVDDGVLGGEIFTDEHAHYLIGGSDGTMNNSVFDTLVRREMTQFGEGSVNYLNVLRYPGSALWDSGFSADTKDALCNVIGRLKTTNVFLGTHIAGMAAYDMATEESMKIALSGMVRARPESTRYGTGALRGAIVGHSMLLNNTSYRERVPLTYSLARMIASYAGAGDGKFKPSARFSRGELAIINDGFDINLTYKPSGVYSSDWEAGLINVRSYDPYRYHFPALYTAYENDRSVCNNLLVTLIIANLEYLAIETWAECTGVSDMTNSQVIKMVNDKLTEKVQDKYDGVVNITPEAYFTPEDLNSGNSISINIHLYGGVMKTVFQTTIVAHRFIEG